MCSASFGSIRTRWDAFDGRSENLTNARAIQLEPAFFRHRRHERSFVCWSFRSMRDFFDDAKISEMKARADAIDLV